MATTVEEAQTLDLDGTKIELRPLKIRRLREFMKEFDRLKDVGESNDASIEVLMDCTVIAMKQYAPDLAELETLEDLMDLQDVYKVIEIASGVKLGGDAGNQPSVTTAI